MNMADVQGRAGGVKNEVYGLQILSLLNEMVQVCAETICSPGKEKDYTWKSLK